MNITLYLLPFIGALIACLATMLAFTLLFRPRFPYRLGAFSFQGVVPKHREEITAQFVALLLTELQNTSQTQLQFPYLQEEVAVLLTKHLDTLILTLKQQIPMGETFLTGALAEKLKGKAKEEFAKMIPELTQSYGAHLSQKVDFKQILKQKMSEWDPLHFEEKASQLIKKEMKRIIFFSSLAGFIAGALIGLILDIFVRF